MKFNKTFALALIAAGTALTSCQKETVAPESLNAATTADATAAANVSGVNATVVNGANGSIKITYTLNTAAARPNVIVELKSADGKYSRTAGNTRTTVGTYSETFAGLKVANVTIPGPPAGTYTAKIYFNSNAAGSTPQATLSSIIKK